MSHSVELALILSIVLAALLGSDDLRAAIFVFFITAMGLSFVGYRLQLLFECAAGVPNLHNVSEHDEVIAIMKETGRQYMKYRN